MMQEYNGYSKLSRAKDIWQREGVISLIKKAFLYVVRLFFIYETFNMYENTLDGPKVLPKMQNFALKIISTPEELDKLVADGFDISHYIFSATRLKEEF